MSGKTSFVSEDRNWRDRQEREATTALFWHPRFGWILPQYEELREKVVSLREALNPPPPKYVDPRTTKPIPLNTSGQYGWLGSKPDFQLEIFGPYPYTTKPPLEPPPEMLSTIL